MPHQPILELELWYGWIYHAEKECTTLKHIDALKQIEAPQSMIDHWQGRLDRPKEC